MVNIKINDVPISVEEGTTILEACREAKMIVPTLCYLKDINEIGACRVCVVEIKGIERLYSLQSCKFFLLFLALKSANPGNILPQKLKTLVFRLPCLIFALTSVEHSICVELCDI